MRGTSTWVAIGGLLLAVALIILLRNFPGAISGQDDQIRLVHGILVLVLVGSSLAVSQRGNAPLALKQAAVWLGIFVGLIAVYSYRGEIMGVSTRMGSEMTPSRPTTVAYGEVSLRKGYRGHFVADGEVNGRRVRFLVDTGASDVALTLDDADRAGINTDMLRFNVPYNTANGRAFAARVELDRVEIGDITIYNVDASVMQNGLGQSLLGMSFLGRLSGFEVSGDELILKQ